MLGAYGAMLLHTGVLVTIPQFVRWIVDRGIAAGDRRVLITSIVALLALSVARAILAFFQNRLAENAAQRVATDLRTELFEHLGILAASYLERMETGQLIQRVVQDVERIRFMVGKIILRIVDGSVLFLGTLVLMVAMSPGLALLSLVTIPLLGWRAFAFGRRQRPLSVQLQEQMGVMTSRVEQNLRGARQVRAFAQEEAEIARFDRDVGAWFGVSAANARLTAINVPLLDALANLGMVIVIGVGGVLAIQGSVTLGVIIAFTTYLAQILGPIRRIGQVIPAGVQALASAERVAEILDADIEVQEIADASPLPTMAGEVRFDEVTFAYPDTESAPAVRDLNLTVAAGSTVALLGATGAGKSTVINLLLRLHDPTHGRVLIDGHDIRHVTLASLRTQIGVVLQDSVLFAASLRDNIRFGRPNASDTDAEAAARAAQIHDFISGLPEGYDTEVGERGVTVSGGQKQRLAIARALLIDPRILVLDDATSSVDAETEQLIQTSLQRLMPGRTVFVIAQRLSTFRAADRILVFEDGRVVADGHHDDLVASSPLYRAICDHQAAMASTVEDGS